MIVGNVYRPQWPLTEALLKAFGEANRIIRLAVSQSGFRLADIHGAFLGHEREYLCYGIEPSLAGATVIADLFETEFRAALKAADVLRNDLAGDADAEALADEAWLEADRALGRILKP